MERKVREILILPGWVGELTGSIRVSIKLSLELWMVVDVRLWSHEKKRSHYPRHRHACNALKLRTYLGKYNVCRDKNRKYNI